MSRQHSFWFGLLVWICFFAIGFFAMSFIYYPEIWPAFFSFVLDNLIASIIIFLLLCACVAIYVLGERRRESLFVEDRELIASRDLEISRLKADHEAEVARLKDEFSEKYEFQSAMNSITVEGLIDSNKESIASNEKSYRSLLKQYNESLAENRQLRSSLDDLAKTYETKIENLRTIQSIRLEANLKAQDTEHRAEIKKLKERENRLAIIIRELIEASCDCEFPFEMLPGSSSPVPCVYVTKDKIWHITKHRTVSDARTMALHEALLKGYGGCPRCMKNLPPYFRF